MELYSYFKSIIDMDRCAVVVCDRKHAIIYMNPAAVERYANRGGAELIGRSLLDCHGSESRRMIQKVVDWFDKSRDHNLIYTFRSRQENKDVYMVALRDGEGRLIGYYEKHEYRSPETMGLYDFGDGGHRERSQDLT